MPFIESLFSPKMATEPAKLRNIELSIVPPDEEVHPFTLVPPPPERLFVDSRGLDIAKEAAEHPLFESDENMRAASERLATGDSLLPGQEGKERLFNAFQSTRSLLGPTPEPFSPTPPSAQPLPPPSPPSVQVAQQEPDPALPNAAPQDTTPPPPDADKTAEKNPKPAKEAPKPSMLKAVDKLLDEQIALTKKQAKPTGVTQIQPPVNTPSPAAHAAVLRPLDQQMARLTTPAPPASKPQPRHESGYQPEQEKNHVESSISNRGKSAVDSLATPMARYRKQVNDAIGSRWYYYIHDKMDLIAFGSVRISFVIDAQGHVSRTKVDSNTSNESLADVSLRAVHDAEIAPPPSDAGSPISQAPLDWTLTFTYYPFSQ
jgi:outer membrane biosynthesis protein TonB